jgi:hypothetical protein
MNIITYTQAVNKQKQGSSKILAFCIKRSDCETCNEWLGSFWKEISEKFANDVEWYAIDSDKNEIVFPPQTSPTWYFYLTNYKDPFIRTGVLPQPEFGLSIDKLIRVQNGEDPFKVFN